MNNDKTTVRCEDLWRDGSLCDDVLVLDVRTPGEFREVHIPGSMNIPLGDLARRLEELRSQAGNRPVALVCRTGRRAQAAAQELCDSGLGALKVLEGGVTSWVDGDLPVNRGEKAVSIERQVRIAAGSLVLLGVLLGAGVHAAFFALSAFVGAGLVFSGVTDTCGMGMLLGRMPWNRAKGCCATSPSAPRTEHAG